MTETTPEQFWEDFYRERDAVWSGKVNALFAREVEHQTPGTALDLGCGEGADAIWLAERGWQVTAVDISTVALERAAAHAVEAGVDHRITFARHNLLESFPAGSFDLVAAQFLHSPVAAPGERDGILTRAAGAVAPGGLLVVVAHAGWPSWMTEPPSFEFPTLEGTLALLDPDGRWTVETAERIEQEMTGPEGQIGTRADTVLRMRKPA
ncbi:27-O-demethylrifamycin SV methyltransferase [Nocardia farcinica]|uniref:class I SAM-dependent methyltransferase n=1 Tax=Nocardia farcinica TaxID=37329 RepID=UPI000BF672F7|nr:class I SAM-dependent methyltransferase [Nocardia farcinica]PFX02761.1 27-O-demethylrifamycin SV methyltransferase [Nocardia farcinica]PFX08383.1 27-O-demethylrifamycin SV methyltransferase [Nocardia farcinica]